MRALGFKTNFKAAVVQQTVMYSKYCGDPKAHVNVCPTAGWIEDFPDPYAALFVPFSGHAIVPINNSNWSVLNDPKVNDGMQLRQAAATDADHRSGDEEGRSRRPATPNRAGRQGRQDARRRRGRDAEVWAEQRPARGRQAASTA